MSGAPGACEQIGARRVVRLVVGERLGVDRLQFGHAGGRPDSPGRSSCPRRRWPSASCAPSASARQPAPYRIPRAAELPDRLRTCLERNQPGPFQIQAAIAAVHADAPSAETKAAEEAQRERDLRVGCEGGMAAEEHQPQLVVEHDVDEGVEVAALRPGPRSPLGQPRSGRTSMGRSHAAAALPAHSSAVSRSATSITQKPPICSFDSA